MAAVLEVCVADGFALWPVAEVESFGFMPLNGGLTPAEVGMAVMRIAGCNDIDPEHHELQADPLDAFLHGLLTVDSLLVPGGLRVIDSGSGVTFMPGCCSGLEDWREWHDVLGGSGYVSFGHDPFAVAERRGEIVRLTVDAEQDGSPVIEVPVTELGYLLGEVERDLLDFLALATDWARYQLPHRVGSVTVSLARGLDLRREGQ